MRGERASPGPARSRPGRVRIPRTAVRYAAPVHSFGGRIGDPRDERTYAAAQGVLMKKLRLVRLVRTISSEVYVIWDADRRLGQVDLHYADGSVQADLFLEVPMEEAERRELIAQLDDDVVSSYLPSFDRDQFIITVFVGQEVESLNYPPVPDETGEA